MESRRKEFLALVRGIEAGKRILTAYGNTRNPDRDQEIILPRAFESSLKDYMKNPVIVAGHLYRGFAGEPTVIGKTLWARTDENGLLFSMQFAATELAEQYWRLYRDGFMRAFSVGFIPKKWKSKDEAYGQEFPEGMRRIFEEVELLEISAVAIPSNRESLVQASAEGYALAGEILKVLDSDPGLRRVVCGASCEGETPLPAEEMRRVVYEAVREAINETVVARLDQFTEKSRSYEDIMNEQLKVLIKRLEKIEAGADGEDGSGDYLELVLNRIAGVNV